MLTVIMKKTICACGCPADKCKPQPTTIDTGKESNDDWPWPGGRPSPRYLSRG